MTIQIQVIYKKHSGKETHETELIRIYNQDNLDPILKSLAQNPNIETFKKL